MINNRIIYTTSSPWIFNLGKAEGCFIWDDTDHKMLDFTCGWNVTNLGWNHPEILEAVRKQLDINTYNPMETTDPMQAAYAQELTDSLPAGLDVIGRTTGGTESNEEAIKTARAFTKRKKIIGFVDTYHGQSYADMSIGYRPEYVSAIAPMAPEFYQIPYPALYRSDLSEEKLLGDFTEVLEKILMNEDVAAVVCEAGIVTGWGTTSVAPKGFLTSIRELTKKYGTLLILDEVGTGFSRCGALFGMNIEQVIPDIATFAKGISNGTAAIGAMVTSKKIGNEVYDKANLTSTFGWTPLACAAALKTLQIHKRDKVWATSTIMGSYLKETLSNELKDNPYVGNIDGKGLEIGLRLVTNKETKEDNGELYRNVLTTARKKGLLLNGSGDGNIQLMPPLVIEKTILDQGIEILVDVIKEHSK
ncbi:MAG: aspartate aminotransferase family protein [bacterium]|nr:aspartate aminotransferase family protein [bacterium]